MYKYYFVSILCSTLCFISCEEEVCKNCLRCISYNNVSEIQNEVKICDADTIYLNDYEKGFIDGAASVGRSAICFDLGIECACE